MALILAVKKGKHVVVGADSFSGHRDLYSRVAKPKIWKVGDVIIGTVGDFRTRAVLARATEWPEYDDNTEILSKFVRSLFVDADFMQTKDGRQGQDRAQIMIAYPGHILTMYYNFEVVEDADPYDAIGSGRYVAIGAMYSTVALSARDSVSIALMAASVHVPFVCEPFTILETS